jgi:hypothetical protein
LNMDTLAHIIKKFNVPLQPDTEHRINGQTMPIDLPIGRNELASLFAELGFKSGAEVGVEQGEYSEVLARANMDSKLFMVDPWKSYRGYRDHVGQEKLDAFFAATSSRMRHLQRNILKPFFEYEIIRKTSVDAARDFKDGSLDYIFLDANHSFDWIMQDLIHWAPKVRPHGICAGHDFFVGKGNRNHQVPIAVKAYTEAHNVSPWFVCRGDHSPTWFWVKT